MNKNSCWRIFVFQMMMIGFMQQTVELQAQAQTYPLIGWQHFDGPVNDFYARFDMIISRLHAGIIYAIIGILAMDSRGPARKFHTHIYHPANLQSYCRRKIMPDGFPLILRG